jgi:hypothetical protein
MLKRGTVSYNIISIAFYDLFGLLYNTIFMPGTEIATVSMPIKKDCQLSIITIYNVINYI